MLPYLARKGDEGLCDGGIVVHGSDRTQTAPGDGAALVLQEPFPRDTRPPPLRRVHGFVKRV